MAMNKKEQAEMQRLRDDLALSRALRWPDYLRPAPVDRDWITANLVEGGSQYGHPQKVARGWFCNAHLGGMSGYGATYGCSNGIHHNTSGDVTTTQNMGRMFATKREALQALRLELTEKCASVLAAVDRQLADCDD